MGNSLPPPQRGPQKNFRHVYCGQTAGWIKMSLGTKVGLGPGHSVLDEDPAPSPQRGWSPCPIFGPFILRPNGWMHQDATWYGGRPQPRRLCVRWGPSPLPKKGRSPTQFSAHVYCGRQTAAWIKMTLGTEIGLSPGDLVVLYGDPAPSPKGGRAPPQFCAHFYCSQTAGCTKMPLGMELGLNPVDFVLDGDPTPSPKRGRIPQIFGPCLLWPNGWMDQNGTWHGGKPQPRRLWVRWGPSPLPKKGAEPPLQFSANFYCPKRLDAPRCHLVWR